MNELASINIDNAIACDDIRQEVNGKFILIGVYSGDVILPFIPVTLPISFWMMAHPSKEGNYHIQFRLTLPGESPTQTKGEMIVQVKEESTTAVALPLPPIFLQIGAPGQITLDYREGDGPWKTVCTLEAKLAPAPPAS